MRKKASKLMVNWMASFVSVVLLMSMLALPALAVVAANSVNSRAIINGQVRTPDLAGDAVTSAKIKNGQVKRADIAVGAIVSGRIADGAVTTAKIRNGHVRSADIAAGAVRSGKIANDAVTSAKIRNGTITNADIAPGLNADKVDGKHASAFVEDTTKTGYLAVPALDFRPVGANDMSLRRDDGWGNLYATGLAQFSAAVNLPNGAKVTRVDALVYDNDSGQFLDVWVYLYIMDDPTSLRNVAALQSSGTSASWQTLSDTSFASPVMDYKNKSYLLWATLSSTDTKLHKVKLTYEYRVQ